MLHVAQGGLVQALLFRIFVTLTCLLASEKGLGMCFEQREASNFIEILLTAVNLYAIGLQSQYTKNLHLSPELLLLSTNSH